VTETREMRLESWDRFGTPNLDIEYGLLGQSHVFPYRGATIRVSLPGLDRMGDESIGAGYVHSWRTEDENRIPQAAFVFEVDLCVQRGHCMTLPVEVLNRHPNAIDLIEAGDQTRLNAFVAEANSIASNAFEYWLSIMRWESGDYQIGRPGRPDASKWSTYLRECESLTRVWSGPHTIAVYRSDAVTKDMWQAVQAALERSFEVPIHLKFFDDAQEFCGRYEFRRSILELAIACEVFMRTPVLQKLPSELNPDVRMLVEEVNANQLRQKFYPRLLTGDAAKKFKALNEKDLKSLFDARNKIMHMAQEDRATEENCVRFIKAAAVLFEIGGTLV
jgi:hypothetical protein